LGFHGNCARVASLALQRRQRLRGFAASGGMCPGLQTLLMSTFRGDERGGCGENTSRNPHVSVSSTIITMRGIGRSMFTQKWIGCAVFLRQNRFPASAGPQPELVVEGCYAPIAFEQVGSCGVFMPVDFEEDATGELDDGGQLADRALPCRVCFLEPEGRVCKPHVEHMAVARRWRLPHDISALLSCPPAPRAPHG
jgi:hypothetical protein